MATPRSASALTRRGLQGDKPNGKLYAPARVTTLLAESPLNRATQSPAALVRLCSRAQRKLWGLRLGRAYGFGIGLSYALLAFAGPASLATTAKLWERCLATASWVAGVGALSLATDLAERDATEGLTALARLRGFGEAQLERARVIAGALKLGGNVLLPGLLLSLASLLQLRTARGALTALALALLTVPYAALVGCVLSVLARACQRLLPGRGRLLLLAVTLLPWLFALALKAKLPSLPGAFAWLLDGIVRGIR